MNIARNKRLVIVWDVLVWILVLFPLLTGGLAIHRPGLKLELAELAVPVSVVALIGWILHSFSGADLTEASSWKLGKKLFKMWSGWVQRLPHRALWSGSLLVGAFWAYISIRRHHAFGSHAYDLGLGGNVLWNLVNGHGFITTLKSGMNYLIDHQFFLFFALAPVFKLFPSVETLLILQAIGLATGGAALYLISRQYLGRNHPAGVVLPLLYWCYLPIRNANAFEFHVETLMLPLFLWAAWGLQETSNRKRMIGLLCFLLALSSKESSGPVAVGLGLAWALGAGPSETRAFTRKLGWISIVLGVAVFFLDTRVVPGLFGGEYVYGGVYRHVGGDAGGIALFALKEPVKFLSYLLNPARLKFLFFMLLPLGFLPLMNWRFLLGALPPLVVLFLSQGDQRINLEFHYSIEPSVALFLAMPGAVGAITAERARKAGIWVLFCALAGFGRSEIFRIRSYVQTPHQQWISSGLVPVLRKTASVAAPGALIPHIFDREAIHFLPETDIVSHGRERRPAECILEDLAINNYPMTPDLQEFHERKMAAERYRLEYQCGTLKVFRHPTSQEACLSRVPGCPGEMPYCPNASQGETEQDCPWAGAARELEAEARKGAALEPAFEKLVPNVWEALHKDSSLTEVKRLWGRSINYDELAHDIIVHPKLITALSSRMSTALPEGENGRIVHAGVEHTYGYLFSLLKTAFGYKRARWVRDDIEKGFGFARGVLGPAPQQGDLFVNVSYFLGGIAFRHDKAQLETLKKALGALVPRELADFDFGKLRIQRLEEKVELTGGPGPGARGGYRVTLRTDLVQFLRPGTSEGANTALLVYSVHDSRQEGPQLISGFPVANGFIKTVLNPENLGDKQPILTRYNGFIDGLSGVSPPPVGIRRIVE